ncbi:endoribonuclease [Lake Baikal phage Baikal-20-5m-C28]|nr:endoribonuclease [Lake Baikal phage Baikal-20-5m-C28]
MENNNDNDKSVEWTPASMLEITLNEPDDFLKVRETLTRIGVASRKDHKIYQSCHILHKQGRYFIVHFKELFVLDGKPSTITENDIQRRNTIAVLLSDWGLVSINNAEQARDRAPLRQIKVLSFKERDEWELCPKYNIGNTRREY